MGLDDATTTWVVWCETHSEYLQRVSASGTTWSDDRAKAALYSTKRQARDAATAATWRDHKPTPWAIGDAPGASQ
jgi:hypothetical protein